jgi:general secretion pathway protein B
MLIVNGQVVREGADLGSGVVLEQITPSVVVLAFRGSQYRVVY